MSGDTENPVIAYLEEENERLQLELCKKSKELKVETAKNVQLQVQFQQAEREMEEVLEGLAKLSDSDKHQSQKLIILKQSVQRKDLKLRDALSQLAVYKARCDSLQSEVTCAKEQQQEYRVKYEKNMEDVNEQREKLQLHLKQETLSAAELRSTVEALRAENASFKDRIASIESATALKQVELEKNIVTLNETMKQDHDKYQRLDELHKSKLSELLTLKQERYRLLEENEKLSSKTSSQSNTVRDLLAKGKTLESKLKLSIDECRKLKIDLDRHQSKTPKTFASKQVQVSVDSMKIDLFKHQISQMQKTIVQLRHDNSELEQQMQQRRSDEIVLKETAMNISENKIKLLEEHVKTLQEVVDSFERKEKVLLAEIVDKETCILSQKRQLSQAEIEIHSAQKEKDSMLLVTRTSQLTQTDPVTQRSMVPSKLKRSIIPNPALQSESTFTTNDEKSISIIADTYETIQRLDQHIDELQGQLLKRPEHNTEASIEKLINDALTEDGTGCDSFKEPLSLNAALENDISVMNLNNRLDERIHLFVSENNRHETPLC